MGLLSPGDEVEPGEVGAEEGAVGGGVAAQSGLALPCQAGGEDHHQPAHRPQHQNSGLKQTFSLSQPRHQCTCITYCDLL